MVFKLTSQLQKEKQQKAPAPRFKLTSQLQQTPKITSLARAQVTAKEPSVFETGLRKFNAASKSFLDPFMDASSFGLTKLARRGGSYLADKTKQLFGETPVEREARHKRIAQDEERTRSSISPTTQKVGNIAGTIAGFAQPTQLAYKTLGRAGVAGLSKLAPKAGKLVTEGVRGASAGLGVGALEGVIAGDDLKGIGKKALIGAAGGAILDPAFTKLGQVAKGLLKRPAKDLPDQQWISDDVAEKLYSRKTGDLLESPLSPPKVGAKTKLLGDNPLAETKERQFAQNVQESNVATDNIKQGLKENKLIYEPITNKETFDKATQIVNEDYNKASELFNSPSKGVSADDVALGEALITKAIKKGNPAEANRLIADLAEKLTTAGQAVQAASIFKKLTPEGMLMYAQRTINSANKDQLLRKGLKAKKILLTAEDSQFILDTMAEAQKLPDGREKDIAIAKVMQLIADKVPATLGEKVKGLQRISLLLNPKTMARNILGNTIFSALDNASNVVATPIDKLTSVLTGKRTTTLPSITGQLKSGLQGAKETIEDARLGIDTYSAKTQFELPSGRVFETKALDKLDKATKVGLQLGDRPFYKAAYDDVLRQQIKLANVTEPTQAMIDQAHKIAQQRTYQDTNTLTSAFKQIQNALNLGRNFGVGNIVVPFTKTPANILKRAIEYSPIGIEKAIREATKLGKGMFDQKTFVDAIARSVTGTALIMVGYDLAKRGVITGSGSEDKDVAAFERNLGKNDFSFKYGDNYYTYDWAQPASMALAIGADVFLKGKDRKEAENVISDAIKSGGETLFKQSLLQGVQRFMGGFNPIDNIETTLINAPTQFVPTLSKQITQLKDPFQRSTFSQSKLGTGVNLVKAKLPGASKTLEPKMDTFGNPLENYQGKNTIFNIFFNPGNSTEFKPNGVQREILRLYESTGDKDIFPKVAPKYFTFKGERVDLTPEEMTTFQRTMGKNTEARMGKVVNELMPEQTKIKYLKKAIELSYEEAKKELLTGRK